MYAFAVVVSVCQCGFESKRLLWLGGSDGGEVLCWDDFGRDCCLGGVEMWTWLCCVLDLERYGVGLG